MSMRPLPSLHLAILVNSVTRNPEARPQNTAYTYLTAKEVHAICGTHDSNPVSEHHGFLAGLLPLNMIRFLSYHSGRENKGRANDA
jgi:hypothetical protein